VRKTLLLYAGALAVAGLYLAVSHPDAVRAVLDKLKHCAGCQRRREAMTAMMRQAQEAVGIRDDA
jgi:hypothetical protein